MRQQGATFNFWPGYVAAISCLVLGLLLTASIIASLITQLGFIAADYAAKLLALSQRVVVEQPARQAPAVPSALARVLPAPVPGPLPPPPSETRPVLPPQANHLTLIFGDQLFEIPARDRPEIAQALRGLSAAPDARWRIWASAPQEPLAQRRNTFRLMVVVRTFLAAEGIPESRVELRLEDGPGAGGPGDIVVKLGPVEPAGRAEGARP